jgi:hypothetical protein
VSLSSNAIQLEQVFINLLANARDAVADAPRKLISISCAVEVGHVCVTVRDTGPGIPEGFEQRIFDPFFTTKDVGIGTGLGLSITYSIIKEHHGTISVTNSPNAGAEFLLEFPLAPECRQLPDQRAQILSRRSPRHCQPRGSAGTGAGLGARRGAGATHGGAGAHLGALLSRQRDRAAGQRSKWAGARPAH